MSFHKPTTVPQKIFKLLQLFWYFLIVKSSQKLKRNRGTHAGILMVVSKLDRIGGLELQALELSSSLIRHGCLITILTDSVDDSPATEFRSGFLIRRLPPSTKPLRLLLSLLYFFLQQRHSFELLHAHGLTGFTIVSLRLAKFLGHHSLLKGATQDDFNDIFQRNEWKQRLYRKWILGADRFIAVSEEMKKEMIACGISEDRIQRIPNAVNTNKFAPVSEERKRLLKKRFSLSPEQTVFLFLGRLEPRKGVDILLQAWKKYSPGFLLIVGAGPEEQRLKQISADIKNVMINAESRFPLDFYQCADVFVFPSVKEGFPGVVLEAMSCGLPCIATKIGGVTDQIEHRKQGLLVSPGDADELANAIQYVALNPEERTEWGREARETVLRRFDVSRISADYHFLYAELLSSEKRSKP
jgi:glycosyltransferase involved in cell wall biosynthesis